MLGPIAKDLSIDDYQPSLLEIYEKLNNKTKAIVRILQKEIARELQKPNLFKKIVNSSINNDSGIDLVDMQPVTKFNKGISFLLCVIFVIIVNILELFPEKDKKKGNWNPLVEHQVKCGWTKFLSFWKDLRKKSFKSILTEIYSWKGVGNSIFVKQFIWAIKSKSYKSMTSTS